MTYPPPVTLGSRNLCKAVKLHRRRRRPGQLLRFRLPKRTPLGLSKNARTKLPGLQPHPDHVQRGPGEGRDCQTVSEKIHQNLRSRTSHAEPDREALTPKSY